MFFSKIKSLLPLHFTKTHNPAIDLLKILGALAVVLNHLLYPIFARADFLGGKGWWLATFLYSASVVAVPLFIIINGFLLLPKKESIGKTYWRIWHRLVVPLLFWFGFYLCWRVYYYPHHQTLGQLIGVVLSGSMYYYYFLVLLIGLQLLLPLWRLLITHGSKELLNLMGIGTFIVSIGTYAIIYTGLVAGSGMTLVSWWLPFTGYFWWGYWRQRFSLAPSFYWLITAISMFGLIIFLSHVGITAATKDIVLLRQNGIFYWHSLVGLPVFVLSIATFEMIMNSKFLAKVLSVTWLNRLTSFLASLTYGVYLCHIFVIEWVDLNWGFAIEFVQADVQGFIVVRTALVLVLSFGISAILTYTPLLRRVVGGK